MKFIALILGALSLYGASEFSTSRGDYTAEFSVKTTQTVTVKQEKTVKKSAKTTSRVKVQKSTPKKKQEVQHSTTKVKLSGYERAKKVFGDKVVEVATLEDAKKLAKSRKDLVVFDKAKATTVSNRLSKLFKKSEFVIMLKVDKRADGEILYNIYFFKKG